ncbi:neutral/alkaline non-lysosomal ceramidase N-terminal domain-containing protein [Telluribacter sp. SYSU D00476]|uniref:neutral/alkaline non-lysosomal ceramidase N-terminal domain-containing protein n=1 Tax=Telluribacter sp. SYSU D00476 TaxID=2811430 RepID=UPI001FF33822|nr:neutral/alkaline non-lysosomal ceramidase N-terminal domain-containing protein [Telluribacter sp. SYSU D00476]
MKFFRFLLRVLGALGIVLLIIILFMVTVVDRSHYKEEPYYREWKQIIAQAKVDTVAPTGPLQVGWAKVNITPDRPTPMAGYGNRRGKSYESVHDSVYVRAMVLDNGSTRAAMVATDLLIVPPTVVERLKAKLAATDISFEQVYLGATHSHNSIGGWGDTITGELFAGEYNPQVVERIAQAIFQAILQARDAMKPAQMTYLETVDTLNIRNRLVGKEGGVDPEVRSIQFTTQEGQKAILTSYGAHSTLLGSGVMALSRDYPGVLVDSLERGTANFAMYMAGAVGSMGPVERGKDDFEEMVNQAAGVRAAIASPEAVKEPQSSAIIQTLTLPLPLREPSPRLTNIFVLRPWVFKWAFGDYPVFVKALRIGNVLMVGMPCDFSGELVAELDAYARQKGLNLMVTSFNGGYIGYITHDKYFNRDTYETVTMSWYGPYNGAYLQEVTRDIVDKVKK